MKPQPDKLFRDKLENYQPEAPSGAWEKIAAHQAAKNTGRHWLRAAASLLLLASVAVYGWYYFNDQSMEPSLAQQRPALKTETQPRPVQDTPQADVAPIAEAVPSKTSNTEAPGKSVAIPDEQVQPKEEIPVASTDESIPDATVSIAENNTPLANDISNAEEQSLSVSPTPKSLTLVFTAHDVNEYKKSEYDATSDDKKPSTLKKLLRKANALTNNQDPLGDLRQKKNEILALNFKSDKQRGQNK